MRTGFASGLKLFAFLFLVALTALAVPARAGVTELISVNARDSASGGYSFAGGMSANGRYVAFYSGSDDLVANDTNGVVDVFVRDRQLGTTRRVSVGAHGQQANDASSLDAITPDGRFVLFVSDASNLVPHDTNRAADLFLRDLRSGTLRRVSLGRGGREGNARSTAGAISADGRYLAFVSDADNLVAGDTNDASDIFLRDLRIGAVRRLSASASGVQGEFPSDAPSITPNGRFVAFLSHADNLVPGDHSGDVDIFVRDLVRGTIERVSVARDGGDADSSSLDPSMSADGRYVAFTSTASNLVPLPDNFQTNVFIRDRHTGRTERLDLAPSVSAGTIGTLEPVLSPTGRFVAVYLLLGSGAYIVDRTTGETRQLVKVASGRPERVGSATPAAISADGRRVLFHSSVNGLVAGDTNDRDDVFLRRLIPW